MPIESGTRLGPYAIEDILGAGGMGEVYRAVDTRLARPVAIKVLLPSTAADGLTVSRLQREARALAAANHPNICTVYDVGEAGGREFLVMELLEGETLQQRLVGGPVETTLLVQHARALVDALDAAHSRNVIHRDLKPGNIFITARGALKVLDFGVARMLHAANGTTQLDQHTGPGVVAGTVAYMSPEQLRGESLDARSDIFALGIVLYEMATGRAPFQGPTTAAVAGAILHESPPLPRELRPDLPARLQHVIVKAMAKDRAQRYQSVAELGADLDALKGDLSTAAARASDEYPPAGGPAVFSRRGIAPSAIATVALAIGIAAVVFAWLWRRGGPDGVAMDAFERMRITQLTSTGDAERPAISPDGKFVAFIRREGASSSLWVRQVATTSTVLVAGAEKDAPIHGATITPDGEFVDFLRGPRRAPALWRAPILGGAARRIVERINGLAGWSPDGRMMAFLRDSGAAATSLVITDQDGGHERIVATRTLPAQFTTASHALPTVRPDWSPDGTRIALAGFDTPAAGPITAQVIVVRAADGVETTLATPGAIAGVAWLGSDALVVNYRERAGAPFQLWKVPFPGGTRTRLTNDLLQYQGLSLTAPRNTLTTSRVEKRTSHWLGDAATLIGKEAPLGAFTGDVEGLAWAGPRLLYSASLMGETAVRTAAIGSTSELTIAAARSPAASADGRLLVFVSAVTGTAFGPIMQADADGSHQVQLAESGTTPAIAPDGSIILFVSNRDGGQTLWSVPAGGGTPRRLTGEIAARPAISHDGRRLAFLSRSGGAPAVVVCDMPACDSARTLSLAASLVSWMPDSVTLAYVPSMDGRELWAQPVDGRPARQLTHFDDGKVIDDVSWSSDGKQIALARSTTTFDIVLVRGGGER